MQKITKKFEFDYGHRVMNEKMKCFSSHGHRAQVHLTFKFEETQAIGYAIDFKEIKRVGFQWLDDVMDHGFLLNPHDMELIRVFKDIKTKIYLMSLNGIANYCNPTAENVSKEIFLVMEVLFKNHVGIKIHKVRFYETPNSYVDCLKSSITDDERLNFMKYNEHKLLEYSAEKGIFEYDDRKNN